MRNPLWLLILLAGSVTSHVVLADGFETCRRDVASASCSSYLNGVVDSALLLGDRQAKARFGETFSERALSSRAGEMVKHSNKRYCVERIPDKVRIKETLLAHLRANKVDSVSDMYDILAVELSCYRSPRSAGTPSDVTP